MAASDVPDWISAVATAGAFLLRSTLPVPDGARLLSSPPMAASDVPGWISAVATAGAFIAAGAAARWTAKTAAAAREQVAAANAQVEVAKQESERQQTRASLAEQRAERAEERERIAAAAAEDRFLQTQLDARAPAVYVRATPGLNTAACETLQDQGITMPSSPPLAAVPVGEIANLRDEKIDLETYRIHEKIEVSDSAPVWFLLTTTFEFSNISDVPACIDIFDPGNSNLMAGIPSNGQLVVPPQQTRCAISRRFLSSTTMTSDSIGSEEISLLQFEYWVRDLGMNVRDTYRFNLDSRHFSRDGSRIVVSPEVAFPWIEVFGSEIPPRRYERIEAARNSNL